MIKLTPSLSKRDLYGEFGDPGDPDFREKIEKYLVSVELPFSLNKGKTTNIKCNKWIREPMLDAFEEIGRYYSEKEMQDLNIDRYHGCFNIREIAGWPGHWSVHSWGCAIDLNAHLGQMGVKSTMPYIIVKAFIDRGFHWGGYFKGRPDGMHISGVLG